MYHRIPSKCLPHSSASFIQAVKNEGVYHLDIMETKLLVSKQYMNIILYRDSSPVGVWTYLYGLHNTHDSELLLHACACHTKVHTKAWFTIWRWCHEQCEHRAYGKKYFFNSKIVSLALNFSTIWLVGCWLTLTMLRWNRNQPASLQCLWRYAGTSIMLWTRLNVTTQQK